MQQIKKASQLISLCLLSLLFMGSLLLSPVQAQDSFQEELDSWKTILSNVQEKVEAAGKDEKALKPLRLQVKYVLNEAFNASELLEKEVKKADQAVAAIEDQESEAYKSAASIKEKLDNYQTQTRAVITSAQSILKDMVLESTKKMWEVITSKGPPPLGLQILSASFDDTTKIITLYIEALVEWLSKDSFNALLDFAFSIYGLVIVVAFVVGIWARRAILNYVERERAVELPTRLQIFKVTCLAIFALGLIPTILLGGLIALLVLQGVLTGLAGQGTAAVGSAVTFFLLCRGVIRAVMRIRSPGWRVVKLSNTRAKLLAQRMSALAGFVAVFAMINMLTTGIPIQGAFYAVLTLVTSLVFCWVSLALLQRKVWYDIPEPEFDEDGKEIEPDPIEEDSKINRFRLVMAALVLSTFVGSLMGYTGYSQYMMVGLLISVTALIGLYFLRRVSQTILELLFSSDKQKKGNRFKRALDVNQTGGEVLKLTLMILIDLGIALLGLLVVLSAWGVNPGDLLNWAGGVARGVTIGSFTFSLVDTALAIASFILVTLIFKMGYWLIDTRVLTHLRIDLGLKQTVKASIGYLGLVVAAGVAIATMGIDLSNIALIAGALSVGIGFGLQNIVSNFVSGLILLVERPVKAGDWVVVGGQEGVIKNINVRATEITTFQKASVIVPNSELLSQSVTNWTHKDAMGRVDIMVGVDYGDDPRRAAEVMVECAKAHPQVQYFPEPQALLMNFGASSLDIELRIFIANIQQQFVIASDIRFAIFEAFQKEGISIPFAQLVISKRDDEDAN